MLRFSRQTVSRISHRGGDNLKTCVFLQYNQDWKKIGTSLSSVKDSVGTIDSVKVNAYFRNRGYGSLLLCETERWMNLWYSIQIFHLQSDGNDSPRRLTFYLDNGWNTTPPCDRETIKIKKKSILVNQPKLTKYPRL
jgi:hypothetical protein